MISALRLPAVPVRAPLLAGEHEQQEQGQVPEAAEEQLPGALPVRVPVEPEAEVGNVQVDGERDDGEGPCGDPQGGGCGGQREQCQAVAQGDPPAQGGVRDRHHAVAPTGVVLPEAPAQRVEVRELPGVEDSAQKKGSCGDREAENMGILPGTTSHLKASGPKGLCPIPPSRAPGPASLVLTSAQPAQPALRNLLAPALIWVGRALAMGAGCPAAGLRVTHFEAPAPPFLPPPQEKPLQHKQTPWEGLPQGALSWAPGRAHTLANRAFLKEGMCIAL